MLRLPRAALVVVVACAAVGLAHAECPMSDKEDYFEFWTGGTGDGPTGVIPHAKVPHDVGNGFVMDAGYLGENRFASLVFQNDMDTIARPWSDGQVKVSTGLPYTKSTGYSVADRGFSTDFSNGLQDDEFLILLQKKSTESNVKITQDVVNGVAKNVVQLTARSSDGTEVDSTAIIQSAQLFNSGKYEVVAAFPNVMGLVSTFWSFHYEVHKESTDPQFVPPLAVNGQTLVNHEIDMEIPASCPSMCPGGGCPGQFDTINLNTYRYTNADGMGAAYANMCVRAPFGTQFADGKYHKYTFEWHTGDDTTSCKPHVNFYFDEQYIGTVNVFVPTRGSRITIGIWGGNSNWVGLPEWSEAYAYVSSVSFTPFSEKRDANFPQIDDEPDNHPFWVAKTITPPPEPLGPVFKRPVFKPLGPPPGDGILLAGTIAGIILAFVGVGAGFLLMLRVRRRRERHRYRSLLASTETVIEAI